MAFFFFIMPCCVKTSYIFPDVNVMTTHTVARLSFLHKSPKCTFSAQTWVSTSIAASDQYVKNINHFCDMINVIYLTDKTICKLVLADLCLTMVKNIYTARNGKLIKQTEFMASDW